MSRVDLRKFEDDDLSIFKQWLQKKHVAKWYTEPNDWINELVKRNDEYQWVHHFLVEVEGAAIGFCQYYDYALGGENWHQEADVKGAYSIDYMIGEESYLGRGFGTEIMFALEEKIVQTNAKKIIVRPEQDNHASRNTLLSANFSYDTENDIYYKNLINK